jgi:Cu(I)/Ag(I) efflux system periplasmic protein CusF
MTSARSAHPFPVRSWITGLGLGLLVATTALAATGTSDTAQGEITKVDRDPPRLTIKHGELKALDMPAMTMVFRVQSPALVDGIKPGDRVRFRVEKINGQYVVTNVEPAR